MDSSLWRLLTGKHDTEFWKAQIRKLLWRFEAHSCHANAECPRSRHPEADVVAIEGFQPLQFCLVKLSESLLSPVICLYSQIFTVSRLLHPCADRNRKTMNITDRHASWRFRFRGNWKWNGWFARHCQANSEHWGFQTAKLTLSML